MEGIAHQYCLRWNNFQNNIASALGSLKAEEDLVDVTLSCGGRIVKAHKVVLSACSPYFREVFKENPCQHPVVILKDVSYEDILSLLSFMYVGEVYITKEQIQTFLQTAELLQIRGLAGVTNLAKEQQGEPTQPSKTHVPPPLSTLYPKHGLHVGESSAQLKHALISKRSRTSTSTSTSSPATAAATTPTGTPSTAPSPPPSPPLGRSSAPSSPQPLAPKRRKAVPRRVSTSSSGSGLPGDVNVDPMRGSGSGSSSGPPGEDGDMERLVVNQAVKQEVDDVESKDDGDDRDDLGDQDHEHDGDSRGEERPYYFDSDQEGEAGTSSSLLARSLAGASPRAVEGAVLLPPGSIAATNNQTMGADLTVGEVPKGNSSSLHCGTCPHCGVNYSNLSALKYHVRLVHSDLANRLCCHLCPRSFIQREQYRQHMWDKHGTRN